MSKLNLISFSLFGDEDIYLYGAISNAKITKEIYPTYTSRFYVDSRVRSSVISDLTKQGAEIEIRFAKNKFDGLFWRFEPLIDKNVSRWISRDCDSRINYREASAVKEWEGFIDREKKNRGRALHVMRDAFNHSYPIMAGMFGIDNSKINLAIKLKYICSDKRGFTRESDQNYLTDNLWRWLKKDALIHDHWKFSKPNTNIKISASDRITPQDAFGCGLTTYLESERTLRHPELFPIHSIVRPFPNHISDSFSCYVGAQFDTSDILVNTTESRWELQLRN
jgi:hypothetical protein